MAGRRFSAPSGQVALQFSLIGGVVDRTSLIQPGYLDSLPYFRLEIQELRYGTRYITLLTLL